MPLHRVECFSKAGYLQKVRLFRHSQRYATTGWRLSLLELAVWLSGCCAVSCSPWAEREGARRQLDSRTVAAAACEYQLSPSPKGWRAWGGVKKNKTKNSTITWGPCCWMWVPWRDCKSPLLNFTRVPHGQLSYLLYQLKIRWPTSFWTVVHWFMQ